MERLILRFTIISLAALTIGSCSRQLDSQSTAEREKKERSAEADRDRPTHPASASSAQGANAREGEGSEPQPSPEDISDDCLAFVWLTKAVPGDAANPNCPQCPPSKEATQVLAFRSAQVQRVSCTGERCEADVVIRANFNPSKGGTITGGLTGWISPEQREQYARGETPSGEQSYEVVITYARDNNAWRVVEFARR